MPIGINIIKPFVSAINNFLHGPEASTDGHAERDESSYDSFELCAFTDPPAPEPEPAPAPESGAAPAPASEPTPTPAQIRITGLQGAVQPQLPARRSSLPAVQAGVLLARARLTLANSEERNPTHILPDQSVDNEIEEIAHIGNIVDNRSEMNNELVRAGVSQNITSLVASLRTKLVDNEFNRRFLRELEELSVEVLNIAPRAVPRQIL